MVVRSLFKNKGSGARQRSRMDDVEFLEERLVHYLDEMDANSIYFRENISHPLAHFQASEVLLENIIGMGEFGTVVEVTGIRLDKSHADEGDTSSHFLVKLQQNGEGMSDSIRCSRVQSCFELSSLDDVEVPPLEEECDSEHDKENMRKRDELRAQLAANIATQSTTTSVHYNYAVKQIRKDLYPDKREEAVKSLAKEQKFLQTMQHPNIVRLRGIVDKPGGSNYMLILDKLSHSLLQQVADWKDDLPSKSFAFPWKSSKVQETENRVLYERLLALYDVAHAVSFLHSKSIVYRDLKVENAAKKPGNGAVQLFDFGLARELKTVDQVKTGDYRLTGLTGTFRIMSPEVIQCIPYGLSTDIFSFGIFAWEVFSGDRNPSPNLQEVCRGQRPECRGVNFPASLDSNLVKPCWCGTPSKRPTIDKVCKILASELVGGRKDGDLSAITNRVELLRQSVTR